MNLSALSRTARQGLSEAALKGCVILARKRGQRGGWSVRSVPAWKIRYKGVDKLDALLEDGWRIVKR